MLNYKSPSPTKRSNSATLGSDVFGDQQYRKRGVRSQAGQIMPETMMPYESYMEVPYQPQGTNFGLLPATSSQWFPYGQPAASNQWTQGWGFPGTQSPRGVQYVLPGTEGTMNNASSNQAYAGYSNMQGGAEQSHSGSDNVDMPRNSGHMMPSDPLLYLQQQQQQSHHQQPPQQHQMQQQQPQEQQQQQATESSAVLTTLLKHTPTSVGSQQQQATPGQQATPPSQVNSETESTSSERLPAFDQAFSQTGIGRFSHEGFHNNNNKQSDLPVVEGDLGLDLTFKMEYQSRNGYPLSPNSSLCDYLYGGSAGAAPTDTPPFNYSSYDRDYNQNRL